MLNAQQSEHKEQALLHEVRSNIKRLLFHPEAIAFGVDLCFTVAVFYLFFSMRDLRAQSADRRKILHGDQIWAEFYNAGQKFWGALSKKNLRAKNIQNLPHFWMTSRFGGEYLRNG